jgi:subtilisin family serine protease
MDSSRLSLTGQVVTLLTFLSVLLTTAQTAQAVATPGASSQAEWWYAPGVLVIEFSDGIAKSGFVTGRSGVKSGLRNVDKLFNDFKVSVFDQMFIQATKAPHRGGKDLSGYYRITFDTTVDLDQAISEFTKLSQVDHVEKVGVHKVDAVPNDASFSSLWGLNQGSDRDIDAPEAWDIEAGDSTILLGAMDTGVQWNHPDLGGTSPYTNGNIWINWIEYNGSPGDDDDGNGYVDDIRGWDWVEVSGAWPGEDGDTPDDNPMDFNGHGTHTSGTMAAITNNGIGVSGVAGGWAPLSKGCRLVPLRIGWSQDNGQGSETGFVRMDFAAQAFYYATQLGVTAVNCSWGSSNSGGIQAALDNAIASGMIVCTSAGNSNNSTASYLASRSDVISVSSLTSSGSKSSFSSYGTWVDVAAPGSGIYSTYSNHGSAGYATLSGTSMASPHVAGLAGLLRSVVPGMTATQVRDLIIASTDDIYGQNPTYVGLLGSGRINALNALQSVFQVEANADVQLGAAPLAVSFSGNSTMPATIWLWHFGDGDSATGQNAVHVYTNPGRFDVTLFASGPGGQSTKTMPGFVVAHADTVEFPGFTGSAAVPLICDVRLRNFAPINSLRLPVNYAGNMDISLDSISLIGSRAPDFSSASVLSDDDANHRLVVQFTDNGGGIPAGDGILFRMFFRYDVSPPLVGVNSVDTTRYSSFHFSTSTPLGSYLPTVIGGSLNVAGGTRGDANRDGLINISDAVYLLNYIFSGGPQPPIYNGDADASHLISISDPVYLINYIFGGGPHPPL